MRFPPIQAPGAMRAAPFDPLTLEQPASARARRETWRLVPLPPRAAREAAPAFTIVASPLVAQALDEAARRAEAAARPVPASHAALPPMARHGFD